MNRERILFVAVVAILGLWFVLRDPPKPVTSAAPQSASLSRRAMKSVDWPSVRLGTGVEPFTHVTNVRPHPRPVDALERPKAFDLPNIWPPTSRSVSIDRLALLRRDAATPVEAAAQIQLPAAGAAGDAPGVSAEERVDAWKSRGVDQKGRVKEIIAGATLREPPRPWPYGKDVMQNQWRFLRLLVRIEDPNAGAQEGVKEVVAESRQRMVFRQKFPDEIGSFQIAIEGKQWGYFQGLRRYLPVEGGEAVDPRLRAGLNLLDMGLKASGDSRQDLLRWCLAILDEARRLVPQGAQAIRKQILLAMLRAANALNDYETVLALAIDHLDAFPGESEVLEYVGDVLASRTFSLTPFAIEWYRRASDRASSQRLLIAALVREGRFEEANDLVAANRAGPPGAEQDLLKARVALALADFAGATALAGRHTAGAAAAEAHQILGAVAYAQGDAAAAAAEFEKAAGADPGRSTAFSDWGLALAVEGRAADALLCFEKALELDRIDNAVVPEVGRAYLKLAAGEGALRAAADAEAAASRDPTARGEKEEEARSLRAAAREAFDAAAGMLGALQNAYPADLLVRYMLGYAKERTGNLAEAADLYRASIDGDSRYRVAIARLGLVQAQRVLAGQDKSLAAAAVAHLSKAVELSREEAILPYLLGRFLMQTGEELVLADRMFERAGKLPVAERNGNLPLWAELGRACLAYADEKEDVLTAKRMLNTLLERIKEQMPGGTTPQKAMEHEVYRAATIDLQIIEDNERKVDRIWDFTELSKKPADWENDFKTPMEIRWEPGKGLAFGGTVNYEGRARDEKLVLDYCSAHYVSKEDLTGGNFWELVVKGVAPPAQGEVAELGIGLITPPKPNQVLGVMLRRKRTGNMEVRIDGADRPVLKQARNDWVELKQVSWPEGEFTLKIEVVPEYGLGRRRAQGKFRLLLNGEDVFQKEFGDEPSERANVFVQSRAGQQIQLWLWAEGRDGIEIKGIQVRAVTLTVETK